MAKKDLNQPSRSLFPTSIDKLRIFCSYEVKNELPNFRILTQRDLLRPPFTRIRRYNRYDTTLFSFDKLVRITDYGPIYKTYACRAVLAYWHDQDLRVRISQAYKGRGPVRCWITFNPAKMIHGHNTVPLTVEELSRALAIAERRLREQGLVVSLLEAKISQIDLYRDVNLPRSVQSYWPLLHRLDTSHSKPKRSKVKVVRNRNFETGLWRGNESDVFCLYDKNQERQSKIHSVENDEVIQREIALHPNRLRLEWRLLDSQAVDYHFGFKTLEALIADYSTLPQRLDYALKKNLLREPVPVVEVGDDKSNFETTENRAQMLKQLLERTPTDESSYKKMLTVYGYDHLLDELGFEAVTSIIAKRFSEDKKAAARSKLNKSLREGRLKYLLSSEGIPYSQLYAEIHGAVFGDF